MKNRIITVFLALSLLFAAAMPAWAANAETSEAEEAAWQLYELGLFLGNGIDENGDPIFDLDKAPTRAQGITMLVRLLGKEEEALAGSWETPFTDVADWAKPYVGYAYANSLTTGTSETTYDGQSPITVSQYLTFVLRALGYTSGTDFEWDKAWVLSDQIGLTHGEYNANTTNFTRGDVAIISYRSLSAQKKVPVEDHSFLVASDFHHERNMYRTAQALAGYWEQYTDVNGRKVVLTIVVYKIRSQYIVTSLHYLDDGTTVREPSDYYQKQANRSYGASKLAYYNLLLDFLEHYEKDLKALQSILSTGKNTGSGTYVPPEVLNV